MPQEPAPADPGRGMPPFGAQPEPDHWEPVITRPDPMPPDEWEALLAASLDEVDGTWRFTTGVPGQRAWIITIDPIPTGSCDHRYAAKGHDPGSKLRHLTEVRYATCTGPACRRPAATCDFEHNVPYEAGGLTCLCNGGPKCRHDHRLKQDPRWKVEQHPDGTFTWTTPAGRRYTTEPTRYPI
jgi:hypothetical protein